MNGHEKRGAPRVPYIADVMCVGAGNRLTARTSDISASGVFIHSTQSCEAGSIVTLRFVVNSTQIETTGEVCYSIPHVGMGVRFLHLEAEHLAAIEGLVESQRDLGESERTKTQGQSIITSGVEPVDKLLGGLERGHLYLAHGDSSGKSLFGIEFLIEGLRRGQNVALITSHRREDAVRRFARLGYDCAEDVQSGALVLFKYSHDVVEQLQDLPHLEPLLRELGPILDDSSPERMVFDPVDILLTGAKPDDVAARANELAVWVRSFGSTVVLVSNEENSGVLESLTPSVSESFRFEVRQSLDRVVRFISFEKSFCIPDQAVRVDPSRGISLLEGQPTCARPNEELALIPETQNGSQARISNVEKEQSFGDVSALDRRNEDPASSERAQFRLDGSQIDADWIAAAGGASDADPSLASQPAPRDVNLDSGFAPSAAASDDRAMTIAPEEARDAFFAMLDELHSFASSLDRDGAESRD